MGKENVQEKSPRAGQILFGKVPKNGLNSTTTVLHEEWLGINEPTKVNMPLNKETKQNQTSPNIFQE